MTAALAVLNPNGLEEAPREDLSHLEPLLNRLRFLAVGCRTAARLDLFKACELLEADTEKALDAHATALVRVIGQALERPATFYAPGVAATSFDEDWLLRLLDRAIEGDQGSLSFLVRSRVSREKRFVFQALIEGFANLF